MVRILAQIYVKHKYFLSVTFIWIYLKQYSLTLSHNRKRYAHKRNKWTYKFKLVNIFLFVLFKFSVLTAKWQIGCLIFCNMFPTPQIRDIFALGPPPIQMDHGMALLARKTQKRPNRESPASKARQMARNKNRDNRQAAKVYED